MRTRPIVLALLLLVSCNTFDDFGPPIPIGLVPFRPADNPLGNNTAQYYPIWWADMERCSGRTGDLAKVEWLYWPTDSGLAIPGIDAPAGRLTVGYYDRPRNAIWIVERGLTLQRLISHEMLHALLPRNGHDQPEWERCGV